MISKETERYSWSGLVPDSRASRWEFVVEKGQAPLELVMDPICQGSPGEDSGGVVEMDMEMESESLRVFFSFMKTRAWWVVGSGLPHTLPCSARRCSRILVNQVQDVRARPPRARQA